MVIKLVRIDSDEPKKICISNGKHLIGRGNFLECYDHRVSRNHGNLEVKDDSVSLTSLHHNPCFFTKKGTSETQILKQNDVTNLTVGDKLGLLPDTYWYEIIQSSKDSPDTSSIVNAQIDNEYDDKTVDEVDTDVDIEPINNVNNIPETQPDSLSLLNQLAPTDNLNNGNQSTSDKANSPIKRSHSSDEDANDVKKPKVEVLDVKAETDVENDVDAKPGPSNDQPSKDQDSQGVNAPPSPAKPPPRLRERCMYGANCYRRNPQHLAQFSHPADADWGGGARGECPWGRGCARRDPRHWRDHSHPPGTQPPCPPQGKKTVRRKKKRADDEDTPEQDLIVAGKRQRKTIIRQDWSGSESENDSDPFLTDGSDEWEPPTEFETQEYTQDTQDTLED